jgi:hypothetical protein
MRFEFLTAVNIKTTVFWDVTSCSLIDSDRSFGETSLHLLRHAGDMRFRLLRCDFVLLEYP